MKEQLWCAVHVTMLQNIVVCIATVLNDVQKLMWARYRAVEKNMCSEDHCGGSD